MAILDLGRKALQTSTPQQSAALSVDMLQDSLT